MGQHTVPSQRFSGRYSSRHGEEVGERALVPRFGTIQRSVPIHSGMPNHGGSACHLHRPPSGTARLLRQPTATAIAVLGADLAFRRLRSCELACSIGPDLGVFWTPYQYHTDGAESKVLIG